MSADSVNPSAALVIDLDSTPADRKLVEFENNILHAATRLNGMVLKPTLSMTEFNTQINAVRERGGEERKVSVHAHLLPKAVQQLQTQIRGAVHGTVYEEADWAGLTTSLGVAVRRTLASDSHVVGFNAALLSQEIAKAAQVGLQGLTASVTVKGKPAADTKAADASIVADPATLNNSVKAALEGHLHTVALTGNTALLHQSIEAWLAGHTYTVKLGVGGLQAAVQEAVQAGAASAVVAPVAQQAQPDLARRSILQERVPPAQGRLDLEETGDGAPTK